MIDALQITNFNHNLADLELFALFCLSIAGHKSDVIQTKVNKLAEDNKDRKSLLKFLANHNYLNLILRHYRLSPYSQIEKGIKDLAKLDLKTCTQDDLLACYGISFKTANFFLLHSRENTNVVVLDTHILSYLREKGYDTPKVFPQSKTAYVKWSDITRVEFAKDYPEHWAMADIDIAIWKKMKGDEVVDEYEARKQREKVVDLNTASVFQSLDGNKLKYSTPYKFTYALKDMQMPTGDIGIHANAYAISGEDKNAIFKSKWFTKVNNTWQKINDGTS